MSATRKALCIRTPDWLDAKRLQDFRQHYEFDILEAQDRAEWLEKAPKQIAQNGPYSAVMIRMGTPPYEPFDADFFQPLLPDLKLIVSASAGFNEFDVDWMTANNIWFCNTVDAVSEATADMAVFLTLAALRDTSRAEKSLRMGKWRGDLVPTRDTSGLKLGIVGLGAIGKLVALKAAVFNMEILYYKRDRLSSEEEARLKATYYSSLDSLLQTSDIVSLNVPLNEETRKMISTAQLNMMKDSSILINTSRGDVVDEAALIQALESGKIYRAGLDVFSNEPHINPYFQGSDRVIVQPHMGGLTQSAFAKAELECLENINTFFKTGKPGRPVNTVVDSQEL